MTAVQNRHIQGCRRQWHHTLFINDPMDPEITDNDVDSGWQY
jgi:hypothetical protein